MLDSKTKTIINNARDILVGKVPNPQAQVDLITIAMIYKFMDDMDNEAVEFGGERSFFTNNYNDTLSKEENDRLGNIDLEPYAWGKLLDTTLGNEARIRLYTEALEKLQVSKQIPELFRRIFKGAFLPFRDGATLTMFLKEINQFSYDNSENLGNAFEFLLSIMDSQGDAGQFRTPRHIIDFIVDIVNPAKDDTILDPACGTAGFLISSYKHILKHNSKDFDPENEEKSYAGKVAESAKSVDIEIEKNLRGDLLTPAERTNLTKNIVGYDISADMQKLALVNLYLHGFKEPNISEYDTLTDEKHWEDNFDIILANPPFMTPKGGIKPHKKFSIQANRSEVLFVDYIIEHLNLKGKAGIIVPEGIVFQSQTAYKKLRKKLVDEDYLYAVVSLPSGVFQPYSGVKTSILLIDREIAKRTKDILFIDVKNDGYDLGANRRAIKENDLPEAFDAITEFKANHLNPEQLKEAMDKYKLANLVPKSRLAEGEEYQLTGSRYFEAVDYSNCKWPMVKLADVCNKISDIVNPSSIDGKVNYIGLENIESNSGTLLGNIRTDASSIKSTKNRFKAGDILYGKLRPNLNKVYYATIDGICSTDIYVLRPKENAISKFISIMLRDAAFNEKVLQGLKGAQLPRVDFNYMSSIIFPLPPLKVQEEIVKELDAYQQVIDGAKKVVENWKPSFTLDTSWKKAKLGDICDVQSGGTPSRSENKYWDNGTINWYSSGELNNIYTIEAKEKITQEGLDNSNAKVFPKGSLLIGMYDTAAFKMSILDRPGAFNQAISAIRPNDELDMYFLYLYFSSKRDEYMRHRAGARQQNLTKGYISSLEVPVPPLEEQKEIVAKIEIEEQAVEQCKMLIKLHEEKIANKIKSIWGEEDNCNPEKELSEG